MGRIEDLSHLIEHGRLPLRPPKYRISEHSQRLSETQPGDSVTVHTLNGNFFSARVVRYIFTPKQPNNPMIELQIGWNPSQLTMLGAGTSVTKTEP